MTVDLASIYAQGIYDDLNYRDVLAPRAQYNMALVKAQYDRRLRDEQTQFDRGKASLHSPLSAAGIGNSGVANQTVTNYLVDHTNAHDDLMAQAEEARQQILNDLAENRRQAAIRQAQAQQTALGAQGQSLIGQI